MQSDQKQAPKMSFNEWLKSKGVAAVMEDSPTNFSLKITPIGNGLDAVEQIANMDQVFNEHPRNAGNIYKFEGNDRSKKREEFIQLISPTSKDLAQEYVNQPNIKFKSGTLDTKTTADLYVSPEVRKKLEEAYIKEVQPTRGIEEIDKQLELIEKAKAQIAVTDEGIGKTEQEKRAIKNFDTIGKVAELLRNRSDEGHYADQSVQGISAAASIHYATNYPNYSTEERTKIESAMSIISGIDNDGNQIGGLQNDVNFYRFRFQLDVSASLGEFANSGRIRENVNDLLDGGQRKISSPQNGALLSMRAQEGEKNSFYQQRFFPDDQGKSETDTVVLHAGGMAGHSAMRILHKVQDDRSPGGYKYTYTKIDAGAGAEAENTGKTKKYYPIFTTEITPAFKKEKNGDFTELTQDEKRDLQKDPEAYSKAMRETLEALLDAERRIEFYNAPTLSVDQGESKAQSEADSKRWNELNDRINTARGTEIQKISLPIQRSGNCTVYSTSLCFAALAAISAENTNKVIDRDKLNIGMDFIQQAKTYNHHTVLNNLNNTQRELESERGKLSPSNDKGTKAASMEEATSRVIMQAAIDGVPYQGQDPIKYAIENGKKLNDLHPLEWALAHNRSASDSEIVKIDGKAPVTWALENGNKSKINGVEFLEYAQKYHLQPKKDMAADLASDGKNVLDVLLKEYAAEKEKARPDQQKIERLETFYKEMVQAVRPKLAIMDKESDFGKMLNSASARKIAEHLHEAGRDIENKATHPTQNTAGTAALMECCTLDVAYKAMKVGKEIENLEAGTQVKGVKALMANIKDFVRGKNEVSDDVAQKGVDNLKKTVDEAIKQTPKIKAALPTVGTSSWVEKVQQHAQGQGQNSGRA